MMQGEEEPRELICPITGVMFRDPVMAADGRTYERAAFLELIARRRRYFRQPTSPYHGGPLEHTAVVTNWAIRDAVERWFEGNPLRTPDGWDDRDVPPPAVNPNPDDHTWWSDAVLFLAVLFLAVLFL